MARLSDGYQAAEADRGQRFAAEVGALTAALGDPTRRAIFLYVGEHPASTTREVAEAFSLHANVARHHLERLVASGHLEVSIAKRTGSTGRPAKRYAAASRGRSLELTTRLDDLLVALLRGALSALGPEQAEAVAYAIGEDYGRQLATQVSPDEGKRSVSAAMRTIADALTAHGFAAHAEEVDGQSTVVSEHCPFGSAAVEFPVLCAVDRGMVSGMLAGLSAQPAAVTLSSRARGDDACAASA